MAREVWRLNQVSLKVFFKKKGWRNLVTKKTNSKQVSLSEHSVPLGMLDRFPWCPWVKAAPCICAMLMLDSSSGGWSVP